MRLVVAALVALVGMTSVVSTASGDELVEAARKERARQEAIKKKREARKAAAGETDDKVLSNRDILRSTGTLSQPSASSMSSASTPPSGSPPATDAAGAPAEDEKGEKYWRGRMAEAREAVTEAKQNLADGNENATALRRAASAIDDPVIRYQKDQERMAAETKLGELQKALAAAEKAIDSLRQEGRRAGASAGWLR